jgi:acetate---CoA ligase (ADP-forming) subunit beta
MDLIDAAVAKGQAALSEYESKQFLAGFGIPVTREALAQDAQAASRAAAAMGFPVVLKAAGTRLFHKTEVEGVSLNLRTERDVEREGERLLQIPNCEALLVQEMVKGGRELVCGLTRDPHFGPCVMFGIGGILTEVLKDTSFRLAPLTPWDARDMLMEIRGTKIFEPFRGEAAVNLDVLAQTLVALGEIGLKHEAVAEIDINPLKIRPDGTPVAVDALVVLKRENHPER